MDTFWSVLRMILFFAGVSTTVGSSVGWQYYVAVVGYIIGPFIYLFACVTSYWLYRELKRSVDESNGAAGAEEQGGGGYAAQEPSQSGGGQGWVHQEAHPSASTSSFKPFSGQGNRLGGS